MRSRPHPVWSPASRRWRRRRPRRPCPAVTIACNDVAGLVAAITAANGVGPSTIDLAPNCTYLLTAANNTSLTQGANGLPIVRKTVVLVGSNTTIERSSGANFRILEVAGASLSPASLTLQGVTVSGGHTSGLIGNAGRGGCLLSTYTGVLPTRSTLTLAEQRGGGLHRHLRRRHLRWLAGQSGALQQLGEEQ